MTAHESYRIVRCKFAKALSPQSHATIVDDVLARKPKPPQQGGVAQWGYDCGRIFAPGKVFQRCCIAVIIVVVTEQDHMNVRQGGEGNAGWVNPVRADPAQRAGPCAEHGVGDDVGVAGL